MDYEIHTSYDAKVLFEFSVKIDGELYLVIYGEHINGNFCCLPTCGWGCEMAEPSDAIYNRDRLMTQCGISFPIADAIANSIREKSALTP